MKLNDSLKKYARVVQCDECDKVVTLSYEYEGKNLCLDCASEKEKDKSELKEMR